MAGEGSADAGRAHVEATVGVAGAVRGLHQLETEANSIIERAEAKAHPEARVRSARASLAELQGSETAAITSSYTEPTTGAVTDPAGLARDLEAMRLVIREATARMATEPALYTAAGTTIPTATEQAAMAARLTPTPAMTSAVTRRINQAEEARAQAAAATYPGIQGVIDERGGVGPVLLGPDGRPMPGTRYRPSDVKALPSAAGLRGYAESTVPLTPGDATTSPRWGDIEGHGDVATLDRLFGLMVGVAEQYAAMEPALEANLTALRAELTSLQHAQGVREASAVEARRIADLTGKSGVDLAEAQAQLALLYAERRVHDSTIATRAIGAEPELVTARGEARAEAAVLRMREDVAGGGVYDREREAQSAAVLERERRDAQTKADAARRQTEGDEAGSRTTAARASSNVARAQAKFLENTATADLAEQTGAGGNASWFQRMMSRQHLARGGAWRPAESEQTLGAFFSNKLMTTASFAASGALLYGGMSLGRKIFDEAEALQKELSIIHGQIDGMSDDANKADFSHVVDQIRDISNETGVAADKAALVYRRLAGTYADQQGNPAFTENTKEQTALALKFSKVTGLSESEITDSLTAISLAYAKDGKPMDFKRVLDNVAALQQTTGVESKDLVSFAGDIAPLAQSYGFTPEQLLSVGAVAQQRSALPASALSNNIGRFLSKITEDPAKVGDIVGGDQGNKIIELLSSGDGAGGLREIIKGYQGLDDDKRKKLANTIAGTKEASAFQALVNNPQQALQALSPEGLTPDSGGKFDALWGRYKQTVTRQLEEMGRAIQEFGQKLLAAGAMDAFGVILISATKFLNVLSFILDKFSDVNKFFDGLPGKTVGVYALGVAMTRAWGGVGGFGGLAGGGAGLIGGISRFFSPAGAVGATGALEAGAATSLYRPIVSRAINWGGIGGFQPGQGIMRLADYSAANEGTMLGSLAGGGATLASAAIPLAGAAAVAVTVNAFMNSRKRQQEAQAKSAQWLSAQQAALPDNLSVAKQDARIYQAASNTPDTRTYGGAIVDWIRNAVALHPTTESDAEIENKKALTKYIRRRQTSADLAGLQKSAQILSQTGVPITGSNEGLFPVKAALRSGDLSGNAIAQAAKAMGVTENQVAGNPDPDTGESSDYQLDGKKYAALIQSIGADPTSKESKALAKALLDAVSASSMTDEQKQKVKDAIEEAKKQFANDEVANKIIEDETRDAGQNAATTFEEGFKARGALLKSGNTSGATVRRIAQDRIKDRQSLVRDLRKAGKDQLADMYQAEIDGIVSQLNGFINEDAQNEDKAFDQALALSGASQVDRAVASVQRAQRRLRHIPEGTSAADLSAAAGGVVERAQAAYQQQLTAAQNQADISAAYTQYRATIASPEVRRASLAGQIGTGLNLTALHNANKDEAFSSDNDMTMVIADQLQKKGSVEAYKNYLLGEKERLEAIKTRTDADNRNLARVNAVLGVIDDLSIFFPTTDRQAFFQALAKNATNKIADINNAAANANAGAYGQDPTIGTKAALDAAQAKLTGMDQEADPQAYEDQQTAITNAQTAYDTSVRQKAKNLRDAASNLAKAQHPGDSRFAAQEDLRNALANLANARGDDEIAAGKLAVQNARNAIADQAAQAAQDQFKYLEEVNSGDSVAKAKIALQAAQAALSSARPDQKAAALTALLQAQRGLQDALLEVFLSEKDLAIAVAEGAGDTVKVALLQLQKAQANYKKAQAAGLKGEQLNSAHSEVIRAQSNLTDVRRADRLGDLEYMYEFDKITAQSYIAQLRLELKKIPESNKAARREIERRIKQLRDEMSADLTFNIPSEVMLPTLYEPRRLRAAQEAASNGTGGGTYQDNRHQTIIIDGAQDPEAVAQAVVDALDSAPTTSSTTSSFGFDVP